MSCRCASLRTTSSAVARPMPCQARLDAPGTIHHVMLRGVGSALAQTPRYEDYAVSGKITGKTAPLIRYNSDRAFRTVVR